MRHPIVQQDLDRIIAADLPWGALAGKTVLISGAGGMLPAYMVETLLRLNEDSARPKTHVIGIVRNADRARCRFAAYRDVKDLELVVQDVTAPISIARPVDYVIHAASVASPKHYGLNPVGILNTNVLGTHHLLRLAKKQDVKGFLFFSSSEVYGLVDDMHIPTDETSYGPLDPTEVRSCYAESKRLGETMCTSWYHQYGVPVKIVRPFHTYGPGLNLEDGRVFADFVRAVVTGQDIVITSDGSAKRAFCYLADAVVGFYTVLLKGEVAYAYNVGNDKGEISIRDLAMTLVGLFPEKHLVVTYHQDACSHGYLKSAVPRSCPDITKLRDLGWEPVTTVQEGFGRTVRSFQ